jgi:hypothetical protein
VHKPPPESCAQPNRAAPAVLDGCQTGCPPRIATCICSACGRSGNDAAGIKASLAILLAATAAAAYRLRLAFVGFPDWRRFNVTAHPLPPVDPWLWAQTLGETLAAGFDPAGAGRRQRNARLARLIETASTDSPFYRERFAAARGPWPRLEDIVPVEKAELMHRFDDWATDRRITRAGVEYFLSDSARLADAYLGNYMVWTSSGTSGTPGIFVQDAQSLAVFDALDALRLRGMRPGLPPLGAWGAGQRFAFVAAIGGHFAGVASIQRLKRTAASMMPSLLQWLAPVVQTFSVLDPLDELARELQAFAPTVLICYPSCAAALAQAQTEGALKLKLAEVWVGGEQLTDEQRSAHPRRLRLRAAQQLRIVRVLFDGLGMRPRPAAPE